MSVRRKSRTWISLSARTGGRQVLQFVSEFPGKDQMIRKPELDSAPNHLGPVFMHGQYNDPRVSGSCSFPGTKFQVPLLDPGPPVIHRLDAPGLTRGQSP